MGSRKVSQIRQNLLTKAGRTDILKTVSNETVFAKRRGDILDKWSDLSASPLFRGLSEAVTADVLAAAQRVEFAKGEVLFSPQRFRPALGLVLEGRVEVTRGEMRMSAIGPGELFGAASLFLQRGRYPTCLTALTAGRALLLDEEKLERLLEAHPPLASRYIRYLTERVAFLSDRLDALGAGAAADKLLCCLRDSGGRLEGLSGAKLAATLGLSRATLYRAMDALEQRGLIARSGKVICLTSPKE